MPPSRLFVSQETLDRWLSEERVEMSGDTLTLVPESRRFRLTSAVHFLKEVADGGDVGRLVGKVKDVSVVAELGGDHCQGSVVLGDDAYEVVDGFLGEPLEPEPVESAPQGSSLASAAAAAFGEVSADPGEHSLLGQLFGKRR